MMLKKKKKDKEKKPQPRTKRSPERTVLEISETSILISTALPCTKPGTSKFQNKTMNRILEQKIQRTKGLFCLAWRKDRTSMSAILKYRRKAKKHIFLKSIRNRQSSN